MGFLNWFRRKPEPQSTIDPVFGKLTRDDDAVLWEGWCVIEGSNTGVNVWVEGEGRPNPEQTEAFHVLQAKYKDMRPAIGRQLWKMWQDYAEFYEKGRPAVPEAPEEFISLTSLDWIDVEKDGTIVLCYGFAEKGIWDDATMRIVVKNGVAEGDGIWD